MRAKPTISSKKLVENQVQSIISPSLEVQSAAIELIRAACKKIGLGIDDYVRVIKDGLSAGKVVETLQDGEVIKDIEPDHSTRLKAALLGLEVEGYIKAKGVTDGVTNNFIDVKALIQQFNSSTPTRVTDGTTKKS